MISLVRISLLLEASWPVQFAICVVFLHSDVQPYHLRINVQMCNSHFMELKVIVAAFFFSSRRLSAYWRGISGKRNSKTFPS